MASNTEPGMSPGSPIIIYADDTPATMRVPLLAEDDLLRRLCDIRVAQYAAGKFINLVDEAGLVFNSDEHSAAGILNAALTDPDWPPTTLIVTWCWHCKTYRHHEQHGEHRTCTECGSEFTVPQYVTNERRKND